MNIEKLENQQDQLRLLNLRVWQKGNMVLSKDWEEDIRRNIYSASKSFTSLAVGIAEMKSCVMPFRKNFRRKRESIWNRPR